MLSEPKIPDEEASQTKALNYLWDVDICGLAGWNDPESSHPRYNNFKNSLRSAFLEVASLQGTLLSNWQHTPFNSGAAKTKAAQALKLRLRDCADLEWLKARAELIAADRHEDASEEFLRDEAAMLQQWEARENDNRTVYVHG